MKRVLAISVLAAMIGAGCAAPRCEQAHMKEAIVAGVAAQKVYDAAEGVLGRYFEIAYSDPDAGIITTRRSRTKGPEEGIVEVRAIVVITEGQQGAKLNLKVVKERYQERWDIWGHNIVEEEVFIGADQDFEARIFDDIERELSSASAKPGAALGSPGPAAASPAPVASPPAAGGPAASPMPGAPSPAAAPATPPPVVVFPPPPPGKK